MKKTFVYLTTTFAFIFFLSMSVNGQNLLTNPGMESWTENGAGGPPDNYYVSPSAITAAQEAITVHSGTYSAGVTWTTQSNVEFGQYVPVTAGNNYQLSFWAYDNDPGGRARVLIRWYKADTTYISGYYGDYTTDSPDWQQLISISQTAPDTSALAKAEIRFYDVSANWPGSATIYIDDMVFEDVSASPAVITDAYSISSTAMDVLYDKDMATVDPSDYQLTGTTTITFSGAAVDGTNAKLVHLTGASSSMTGDATLDNIADDGNGTDLDFYAGITPISYLNTNNPGGTLQNGYTATFQGIASANDAYNNVWFSDAAGQYNGVLIYDSSFDGLVAVGDEFIVAAERDEYNGLTELKNPVLVSTVSTGNTPYGPDVIAGSDIEYTIPSNTNPGEPWEGQLVKIEDVTVDSIGSTTYYYWCSVDISGTTYTFVLGDNVDYHLNNITLTVGATYQSITGVVDWNGSYYRINPREQSDIEAAQSTPTKLVITSVNSGNDPYENSDFSVVVQAQDASGVPANVSSDVNFTFTTNGGDLGNVAFVSGTSTTGTISSGSNEVTVTGVQMAPAGTGVTITASDNNPFGLAPGTSSPFNVIAAPSYIIYQGFEQSGDTWNYTIYPAAYNTGSDIWDSVASVGSISGPAAGQRFWGMRDLDNPNGGGAFWHTITFPAVDISSYANTKLSFQYYTDGYDGSDEIGYAVEFDNGTAWNDTILLDKNTDAWTTVSINIPGGSNYVRLLLLAFQNGGSDYAGWDDIKVEEITGVVDPSNLVAQGVSTSEIDLTWTENSSGDDVLVAWNSTNSFGTPVDGSTYSAGSAIPGGGTSLGVQVSGSYNHTSLTEDTWYYYKIWSVDGSNTYSTGIVDSSKTYMSLPVLYINEFMALNSSIIVDNAGEYDDWIEIYNPGTSPVDLGSYFFTDDLTNPAKSQVADTASSETTVPAGGFLLFWADQDMSQGVTHLNFKLSGAGEDVGLYGPDGFTPIDTYTFGSQLPDTSMGRQTDGSATWVAFGGNPTPNASNGSEMVIVNSPNGGEVWYQGNTKTIKWFATASIPNVKIELTGSNPGIISSSVANTGEFVWTIPSGQTPATDYKVKISDAADGIPYDESNDVFEIAATSIPDIMIVEIMQNPSAVSDSDGEWFEVFNTTASAIDMNGWIIKDNGTDKDTIEGSLIVPANGFAVLGINNDSGVNGGYTCDYQYSGIALGNGADEIIILKPDGTQVDSVAYDGGSIWPDPAGKSMVFTGTIYDDNNDGTNWIEATVREPSYTGTTGDKGSPGTNGQDQNLNVTTVTYTLDLTVYLEGPFNGTDMNTSLNSDNLLPTSQPYNVAPWNYNGTESVVAIPNENVVDWILVEIRDASSAAGATGTTLFARKAAFLLNDGSIVDLDGSSNLQITVTSAISNDMYIVIWHRNHLAILSASPVTLFNNAGSYDFSTGSNKVYGGVPGYKNLGSVWGMVVGDINADKTIDGTDIDNAWAPDAGDAGYKAGDLNFNGEVNNIDKNDFWFINYNTSSSVPD